MRSLHGIVVVLAASGCNQMLDLAATHAEPLPDATVDAPPLCPVGTTEQHQSIPALEDATLIDDTNPMSHGAAPEVYIKDAGPVQYGLWKFAVATALDTAVDAQLVLPYIVRELDCGSSGGTVCVSCDGDEHAGDIAVYPLTSDWDELDSNWHCRHGASNCNPANGGILWDQPGAGGTDRGPELQTVSHVPASDTTFPLGVTLPLLRQWVQSGAVSLVAVPGPGARAWIAAKTTEAKHLACRPPGVGRLEVTYCL